MADDLDLIYWDSCIFYEHLKQEQQDQWKRQAVDECLLANKQRLNRLCTSTITHIEVMPSKLPLGMENEYWNMFGSMYFYDIAIDRSVILLAREIRNFYYLPTTDNAKAKIMSLGDSIHLATAIIEEADLFYTRDANKKGGNIPLIGLPERSPGGKLCGQYDLRILSPVASQGALELQRDTPSDASTKSTADIVVMKPKGDSGAEDDRKKANDEEEAKPV